MKSKKPSRTSLYAVLNHRCIDFPDELQSRTRSYPMPTARRSVLLSRISSPRSFRPWIVSFPPRAASLPPVSPNLPFAPLPTTSTEITLSSSVASTLPARYVISLIFYEPYGAHYGFIQDSAKACAQELTTEIEDKATEVKDAYDC